MTHAQSHRPPRHGRDSAAAPGRSAGAPRGAGRHFHPVFAAVPAGLLLAAAFAHARYATGPPLAHTGGFGEPTCYACHADARPNTGTGSLALRGLDAVYRPGATRRITVELVSPGMRRAGFQLAVRFATGGAAGTQAGTLRAPDERVSVTSDAGTGVQYAHQLEFGSFLAAPDTARWVLEWTAPEMETEADVVVFHLAANAGNDDASPFGDFIFTDSMRLRAATAGAH